MPEANLGQKAAEGDKEDQEEDQLGMLGSMEHADNHNRPRETIEDNCASSEEREEEVGRTPEKRTDSEEDYNNTVKQNLFLIEENEVNELWWDLRDPVHFSRRRMSLSNVSTTCPTEAESIRSQHNISSVNNNNNHDQQQQQQHNISSENNNHNHNHYNSSEGDPNERVSLDSLEEKRPDSISGGGSETPKQCLGAHELKKTFALVGHKTPLLRRSFGEEALALVGHRHPRSAHFWIEEYAPVHTGIGCAHSVRRGARNNLCISPCGQLSCTVLIDPNWLK